MRLDTNTQESFSTVLHRGSLLSSSKMMCLWWKWQPLNFLFYTMTCCKESPKRTHADVPEVLRKLETCFLFLLLKEKGLTVLLYLILSFQLREPLCTAGYNIILANKMGSIKSIFLPNIFIGTFHHIKQLPVCLFCLASLTCAGTIHSKGKAIAHGPFIDVTWMFVP